MGPARRSARAAARAGGPVNCPPDRCPPDPDDVGLSNHIIPGHRTPIAISPRQASVLIADSGLIFSTHEDGTGQQHTAKAAVPGGGPYRAIVAGVQTVRPRCAAGAAPGQRLWVTHAPDRPCSFTDDIRRCI